MPRTRSYGMRPGLQSGVLPYRYALTPWVWDTSIVSRPYWRLPASVGSVDLRPWSAQAAAGGAPQGFGFCASLQPTGNLIATAPHMSEADATVGMRDAWQSTMGYRPSGLKLTDLLWDQLTTGSDPSGTSGPKPLVPGTDNVLRLRVGGHSEVKSEPFRWGAHSHTSRLRDLLQRDFESQWEATNGNDHCRRCLDHTCEKYHVDDWKEFVPTRLRGHVAGRLPHQTTISDNFNRADESLDIGPWNEVVGNWSIVTNQCSLTASATNDSARHTSSLSSADHYSQFDYTGASTGSYVGPAARFAAAANTHYSALCRDNDDLSRIYKTVTGTLTLLIDGTFTFAVTVALKLEVNGSSLALYIGGASANSVTDTAITGNVQCGMWGNANATANTMDNFTAADLAAGSAAPGIIGGGVGSGAFVLGC